MAEASKITQFITFLWDCWNKGALKFTSEVFPEFINIRGPLRNDYPILQEEGRISEKEALLRGLVPNYYADLVASQENDPRGKLIIRK